MANNSFQLHSVNVVVTAHVHNPSILSPDFLKTKQIVPEDWVVKDTITTPPVSTVNFDNGVSWTIEEPKMTIAETCDSSFESKFQIHDLAIDYVAKLPHVLYRDLGLNCRVTLKRRAPERWVTQRFLKPGDWSKGSPKLLGLVPKLVLAADDALCMLTIQGGKTTVDSAPEPAVIIDCNFHHKGPLTVDALQSAIQRWPERQASMLVTLDKLLRKRQT